MFRLVQRVLRRFRPLPSYEDGKFRDPSIEGKQDPEFRQEDLEDAIRKAARREKTS